MTMCIRGKSQTSAVAASSSSTERVVSESHRVDEINLVEKFQSIGGPISPVVCKGIPSGSSGIP